MFTMKHERKSDGTTHVFACTSYVKQPVNDLGKKITQINLAGDHGEVKLMLECGDVVYVENIKGKTIDVIKAPAA